MNTPPVKRQRKPAEQRRREIVDAVLRLAYEQGPDGITAEAIARRVGFAQPAIFRHFPTMVDIWLAVADEIGARLRESWAAADEPSERASNRLRRLLQAHLGIITQHPGLPSILFSRELQASNQRLQAQFVRHMQGFAQRLEALIATGIADGEIRHDLDPAQAAYSVIAIVQGTALRWTLTQRSFDLQAQGLAAFDCLWKGLESR